MRSYNDRMKEMNFGGLYEIFSHANKLEASGKRIIHMEIGRPDFDSPQIAKEAVKEALDRGEVHYTDINGVEELRRAICEKERRRFGLEYDYESEIAITAGACEAISSIILSYMNFGEEIIIPTPYFSAYTEQAIIAGVNILDVPLSIENNWELDPKEIEKRITEKTKVLMINSPSNPAGYILSKENLQKIADIAIKYDLLVISDECYDEFVYGEEFVSIATLPEMFERTLVVKSTSKSFSMTGWRIAYVLGPSEMVKYINKVHQNLSTCATAFAQWGAVAAFDKADSFIDKMVEEFRKRGEVLYEKLSQIPEFKLAKPEGAFYLYPEISATGMTDKEMASYLMEEAGVVVVPGSSFGSKNGQYIRLAYCRSMDEIIEAGDKITKAIAKLREE
ncbi:pyridoxal phosphate-dependent aminotransferase [Peptoniphilus sp. KCTC 25270]|uniref:pyridoxal phosphate-dependent aminotransferase n=1 Tax=Peptoniphilus sp. KCTC 25270 TaxID=2897414 RepID=UPI001E5AC1FA|nr:pyridoxal phosphate-dependent aminotransferase [Peptoniphilus sp. KCTC 25270]MCD1146636.1 pyridoxal phosphate-dependent aminotransferase [Peptoniphilus sp. KCTC 25270]